MTSNKVPSLVELAEQILAEARKLESLIPSPPDFQNDTLEDLPGEHEATRLSLIDKTELLNSLVRGSTGVYSRMMRITATQYMDEIAIHFLHEYKIPQRVPLEGSKSFEELAKETGLPLLQMSSLLRMATLNHIFYEPERGVLAHTADSRVLAMDQTTFDHVGMVRNEHKPATAYYFPALAKWKGEPGPGRAPWNLANGTSVGMYEWLSGKDDPDAPPNDRVEERKERLRQFGSAMTNLTKHGLRAVELMGKAWPWKDLNDGATVVDVGGGNGHISIALAEQFPGLNFIVQDTEMVVGKGVGESLPDELKGRVKYEAYDFFTPQPVKDADVYFFANILHNWSDDQDVDILKNLVPALKPGARVLVCDRLIPDPGTEFTVAEKEIRGLDLMMYFLFNAREREASEIKGLFEKTDGRFEWGGVYAVPNGLYKICEGIWKG